MKTYKRHKLKEDNPLHDEFCDCYDCHDPWDDYDDYDYRESNGCECDECNDWWSTSRDCEYDAGRRLYEKKKKREDIINDILYENRQFDELLKIEF